MPAYALSLFLALVLTPQQGPDTTRPAPDTQAVVLPVDDTTRMSPIPAPPALQVPRLAEPPASAEPSQQAPADTARTPVPDTLAASADTSTARAAEPDTTGTGDRALRREVERLQRGLDQQFEQLRETFSLARLLMALLALAVTYLFVSLVTWLLERIARWRPRYAFRIRPVIPLVKYGLWFVALWIVFGGLFAGGSPLVLVVLVLLVIGAGMVAGFQFLRDLAGGLVLSFEQPFQIGSRVRVGPHQGEVQHIGLRAFELATPDGAIVVIPNAEVLRSSVTATQPDVLEGSVAVELAVPETVDLDEARVRVREAAYASPYLFAAKPVVVALAPPEGPHGGLRLRVEAYAFNAQYAQALASDVVRLAQMAFAADGDEGGGSVSEA